MAEKQTRTVDVGFTKIGDDVIVPSWRAQSKEGESFRDNKIVWWVLGGFWLLGAYVFVKDGLEIDGIAFTTIFILFLGAMWYFLGKIPQKWIEFNRKGGFVYVWTSRKKRRLIGRWHVDQVEIKMNRRWVASSPRSGENRYLIELFDKNPAMKNTPFWKFDNHPQRKGVPFFVLFDLFKDEHSNDEPEDRALAWAFTHQVDKFIRDFMAGRPIPESSSSTYTFTVPE
jgi:hypothetical protein